MSYLFIHILTFVLIAAVLGFIIGWMVHRLINSNSKIESRLNKLEAEHNQILDRLQHQLNQLHQYCHQPGCCSPDDDKGSDSSSSKDMTQKATQKDDLTRIHGVGKVLERLLHEEGIHTFEDVANISDEKTLELDDKIFIPGRIQGDHWREQATELAKERLK